MARDCRLPLFAYWRTHEHGDGGDSDEPTDHQKTRNPEEITIHSHSPKESHVEENNGHLDQSEACVIYEVLDEEN